jgi:RnfABCDGE-type electron transport complex B subunit
MLSLGTVFAIVLLIASIKLKVVVDEKINQVHESLPNIDCGACGFAGCGAYAKAVVSDPELLGACAPGGAETSEAIARILNLQMSGSGSPVRPIVRCRAHTADRTSYAEYAGIETCTAANAQAIVQACKFGCMGFGDCLAACRFDAITITDGLSTIDYEKCTGCGACEKTCPRNLIIMVPFSQENMLTVGCSSCENGKTTRSMCKTGCIGCGLCSKQTDIFVTKNNLAKLDHEKYFPNEATETAVERCPTGVIVYRGKSAPAPRAAGQKPAAKK